MKSQIIVNTYRATILAFTYYGIDNNILWIINISLALVSVLIAINLLSSVVLFVGSICFLLDTDAETATASEVSDGKRAINTLSSLSRLVYAIMLAYFLISIGHVALAIGISISQSAVVMSLMMWRIVVTLSGEKE